MARLETGDTFNLKTRAARAPTQCCQGIYAVIYMRLLFAGALAITHRFGRNVFFSFIFSKDAA